MTTKMTPDEMENMARGIATGDLEQYWKFCLYFGPRFRAIALREGISEINAEIYADECCEVIPLKTPLYFAWKAQQQTEDCFYEKWVFSRAKKIRLRYHSAIHWTQAQPGVGDDNQADPKRALTEWLHQEAELVSALTKDTDDTVLTADLAQALRELPALQREILWLRVVDGTWSYEDIGRKFNLSANAARVYCHRARQKLKERFWQRPLQSKRRSAKS